MADNAIVEEAKGETAAEKTPVGHALEGAGMAQDFIGGTEKILSGDWAEGLLDLGSGAMDVKGFLKDPIEGLLSMGFGWIIEHVDFLKEPLDWLTGDQDTLDLTVQTWAKISEHVQKTAEELTDSVQKDCAHWEGPAADQYRTYTQDQIDVYVGLSDAAHGVSGLVDICKTILNVVRTIIRDLIADTLAKIVRILLKYPPPAYPAALAAEGVPFAIEKGTECMSWVQKLTRAFQKAADHLAKLGTMLADAAKYLARGLAHNSGRIVDAMKTAVKDLPMNAVTEVGKEMGKTIAKNVYDQASASDTEADGQPVGRESRGKRQHDRDETRIFPEQGKERISGTLE
ncbi:hypothetical protein [Amycolatopsis nigrescens]|uniref:hypothetical protein n=1 Tax=Amycolatopsis nigrescens TaxID=381445 RepID=UPI000374F1CD|nr:hypothetical protein [Amycolatopsis nigrescens]